MPSLLLPTDTSSTMLYVMPVFCRAHMPLGTRWRHLHAMDQPPCACPSLRQFYASLTSTFILILFSILHLLRALVALPFNSSEGGSRRIVCI